MIRKAIDLLVCIILGIQFISCSGESEETISEYIQKEKELFEQIKVGMHSDEVIKILGKPDTIYGIDDSTSDYYFFTEGKSILRSQLPVVSFDSTDTVTFATYGG